MTFLTPTWVLLATLSIVGLDALPVPSNSDIQEAESLAPTVNPPKCGEVLGSAAFQKHCGSWFPSASDFVYSECTNACYNELAKTVDDECPIAEKEILKRFPVNCQANIPTQSPTHSPTHSPTFDPTETPTETPTTHSPSPSPSHSPTEHPTAEPTHTPTEQPTDFPTREPTADPTHNPTASPTNEPTPIPSKEPTDEPSRFPTRLPTDEPTQLPTNAPTAPPTYQPTGTPTEFPTTLPPTTDDPSFAPTHTPSEEPTASPTDTPTLLPTDQPTNDPTNNPTLTPTHVPTHSPTASPTEAPTLPACKDLLKSDVVLLVDSSNSIEDPQWSQFMNFIDQITSDFPISQDGMHLGGVQFGTRAFKYSNLEEDKMKAQDARKNMAPRGAPAGVGPTGKMGNKTNLHLGLEEAMKITGRKDAVDTLLVLTDGLPTDYTATGLACRKARSQGFKVVFVLIGTILQYYPLDQAVPPECMSAPPVKINDFDGLEAVRSTVVDMVCEQAVTTSSPRTATVGTTTAPKSPPLPPFATLMPGSHNPGPGMVMQYYKKYEKKNICKNMCENIACLFDKTKCELEAACNAAVGCTGFSFTTDSATGSGCLKKCGDVKSEELEAGTHDYWARGQYSECKATGLYNQDLNDRELPDQKLLREEKMCITCIGQYLQQISAAYAQCAEATLGSSSNSVDHTACAKYADPRAQLGFELTKAAFDAELLKPSQKHGIASLKASFRALLRDLDGMHAGCNRGPTSCTSAEEFTVKINSGQDYLARLKVLQPELSDLELRQNAGPTSDIQAQSFAKAVSRKGHCHHRHHPHRHHRHNPHFHHPNWEKHRTITAHGASVRAANGEWKATGAGGWKNKGGTMTLYKESDVVWRIRKPGNIYFYRYMACGNLRTIEEFLQKNARCCSQAGREFAAGAGENCPIFTRATASPTTTPTRTPTRSPTPSPTNSPTAAPSNSPTAAPSNSPTAAPSNSPTDFPTAAPSSLMTMTASKPKVKNSCECAAPKVAEVSTRHHSHSPSPSPSHAPTFNPTAAPTSTPTETPTTHSPSPSPSHAPTEPPTAEPTHTPTVAPTPATKLTGTATQSSTGWSGPASKGIDGNTNTQYNGGSCTHTYNKPKEWWRLAFGKTRTVTKVKVWNRSDCCEHRLAGATVVVGGKTLGTLGAAKGEQTVNGKATGTSLQINNKPGEFLTLCEVKVFGY